MRISNIVGYFVYFIININPFCFVCFLNFFFTLTVLGVGKEQTLVKTTWWNRRCRGIILTKGLGISKPDLLVERDGIIMARNLKVCRRYLSFTPALHRGVGASIDGSSPSKKSRSRGNRGSSPIHFITTLLCVFIIQYFPLFRVFLCRLFTKYIEKYMINYA